MADSAKYVVAVVDDDQRVLESMEDLLESAGYAVRLYPSAESLLENDGGLAELDCLISDIGLPVMDGFELRRVAKATQPGLPVILITGRHELSKLTGTDSGRVFQKPLKSSDLLAAISKALGASPRSR